MQSTIILSKSIDRGGSQLLNSLVQSRPRSTIISKGSATKTTRVASAKAMKTGFQKNNHQASSSTAQLKVSQFSQGSMVETRQQSNLSQKFFTIKLKDDVHETLTNDERYFTTISDMIPISENTQPTLRELKIHLRNPSNEETPAQRANLKSFSSGNVLRQSNRQQQYSPSGTCKPKKVVSELKQQNENKPQYQQQLETSFPSMNENYQVDQNMQEINKKIELVLNKYRNCSFFSNQQSDNSQQLVEREKLGQRIDKIDKIENVKIDKIENQQSIQKILVDKIKPIIPLTQRQADPVQQSTVNKYITRVSRGKTFMGQVFSTHQPTPQSKTANLQTRQRMNSPAHKRITNDQSNLISYRKDAQSPTRNNLKQKITSPIRNRQSIQQPATQDLFVYPFNEFGYHTSFLQYFHQSIAPFKNTSLIPKIQNLYNKKNIQYFQGLYKEHYLQSFHALQFTKDIQQPSNQTIQSKIQQLPLNKFKKTIVFDLDETLIHCNESNDSPSDVILSINFPTGEVIDASIRIRPYCREMLRLLSQQCEVVVFTASHECYASKVLDWLDPQKNLIHHRLFRESCVIVDDGLHVKDLRVLGNRKLKDTLIVDNAAYSYCFHLKNGVPIIPFYESENDRELIYLTAYLLNSLQQNDMSESNDRYFQNSLFIKASTPEEVLQNIF